ncbi:hypothetical protein KUB85_001273 [Enterococcus faecalis]|uniref:hypothetical protein n=1 Tax=Enterococcus faecalis TaxID=1351 RepID=UPI001E310329|nr:hypothetical protein [Enterococcus faecalis]EHR4850937.1 hypothetical protein [Enterococcus faecalis]EMC0698319.1 hypothetical protein [Enterococcus faecalis]MCD5130332.1 hypothetical protein [Enterococcus faecalis]MDV2557245.1 hypothetical protein [Enterococcus faecalis]MDY2531896.1 hypothetical protein [Enterococcus faecalis]
MKINIDVFKQLIVSSTTRSNKRNWANRESLFYIGMLLLTLFGLVFILASRSIFGDDSELIDAGTGKRSLVAVGSTEVMIIEKTINPESNYGEILLRVDQPVTEVGITYEAIAGENETKMLISSKLSKIYDQYYLLQLNEIPKNWRQLVIDFGYTSAEKPKLNISYDVENLEEILKKGEQKTEQATFIFDYREMAENKKLVERTTDDYIVKVTEIEIRNVDELAQKIEADRKVLQKEIQLFESKIEELEEQKTYLTEEQIKQTDSEINRVQREISSYEVAITDMDKQEAGLQEKKQKLIERHRQSATLNDQK